MEKDVANALREVFISPNESDRNFESANVVDGLFAISRSIRRVADALNQIAETQGAIVPRPLEDKPSGE